MAANRQTDIHTYIHTHVRNAVTLVWGSFRLAPIIILSCVFATAQGLQQRGVVEYEKQEVGLQNKISVIDFLFDGSLIAPSTTWIYNYHHSTKLYRKISRVCCRYECAARGTMPTATNEWYFFWYSSVLWFYQTNFWFYCTFRRSVLDLQYLTRIFTRLVVQI